ncbi:MAG: TonB family protein [Colwellia sp.]
MINWLFASLLPLTLLLSILLLVRKPLSKVTDATTIYRLWLLIPLSLLVYTLPLPWQYVSELNNVNIETYLVKPTQNISHQLITNSYVGIGLSSLWFIGFVMLILYWLNSHRKYYKHLNMQPLMNKDNEPTNNIPTQLMVKQSCHIYSPLLIGLFTQTLVIPEDFDQLYSKKQQKLIIAHEVCHFSHHHMWTNQLALLLLALFWFHPLAWRAYAVFRQDQEHSCDQVVLARRHTQSRIQYCKALVLAAETSPPNAFTLMSFKHNGEQNFMLNRIKQIKNLSKTSGINLSIVAVVSASLLVGVSYAGNHLQESAIIEQAQENAQPVYRIEPKYPIKAANEKIEGSVVLKFDIKGDGSVTNVGVVTAKPVEIFNKESIRALKQWRYQATGQAVKDLVVQLDFMMDSSIGDPSKSPRPLIEKIKVTQ